MSDERMSYAERLDQRAGAIPIDPIGDEERERIHTALIAGGLVSAAAGAETWISVPPPSDPMPPIAAPGLFADDGD